MIRRGECGAMVGTSDSLLALVFLVRDTVVSA